MQKGIISTRESVTVQQPGVGRLVIRAFDADRDSLHAVNALRRQASLATLDAVVIRQRADEAAVPPLPVEVAGSTLVAVSRQHVVGVLTLRQCDPNATCEHYRRGNVAIVRDLAVEPSMRHLGIGRVLLAHAGRYAAAQGLWQLALDVPYTTEKLLSYCRSLGFSLVDVVESFAGDERAVFSRPTIPGWPTFYVASRKAPHMRH